LRRRSLGLLLVAVVLATLVSLGKVKSAAARAPRAKTTRSLAHRHLAAARLGRRAVAIARRLLGEPYRYGGTSPASGFDCSGLVYFVYSRLGIRLPRSSFDQVRVGRPVAQAWLHPGDLLFFAGSSHVGLYVGDGSFIEASHTGANVRIASLGDPWYASRYDGARRVLD
jgi:cell wall-associated NlpC family hydrolase